MADKSPSSLTSPRNIALQKGTVPAGFAGALPLDPSMLPVVHPDSGPQPVGMAPAVQIPVPFVIKGSGR